MLAPVVVFDSMYTATVDFIIANYTSEILTAEFLLLQLHLILYNSVYNDSWYTSILSYTDYIYF